MLTNFGEGGWRGLSRRLRSKTEFPPAQEGRGGTRGAERVRLEPDS